MRVRSWDGGTLFNKIRVPKRMGRPKGQGARRWDDRYKVASSDSGGHAVYHGSSNVRPRVGTGGHFLIRLRPQNEWDGQRDRGAEDGTIVKGL